MKRKILTLLLSVTFVLGAVGFSACANSELEAKIADLQAQIATQQAQIEELEDELELREETVKNYAKGDKMSLETAYNLGLLTKDDLLSIAYYNNGNRNSGNEEIMPEDFVPQPKIPEVLSEELDLKIREACAKNTNYTVDDYYVYGYFGIYGNCVVVKTTIRAEWPSWGREKEVDGITFYYTGPWLSVYCMRDN